MLSYVVIGVRNDGTRRLLGDGLTWGKAQEVAGVLRNAGIFGEVIVELERVADPADPVEILVPAAWRG